MKILFTASVLQRNKLLSDYRRIVKVLIKSGHVVISDHIFNIELDDIYKQSKEDSTEYFNKLKTWIQECDVVVAEVSWPSTINIGFQISYALQKNKSVIALYKNNQDSSFFKALSSDKLIYESYNEENIESVICDCLDFVETKSDVRFNFYLPSNQIEFLDNIGKERGLSRSAVLRQLISEKMDQ